MNRKLALAAMSMLLISGCASLNNAGTASYSVKPMMIDGKAMCCEVSINNGKEIAVLDATVSKRGDDYNVWLHEEGVTAFKGQEIAAHAADAAGQAAIKAAAIGGAVLIAPIAAPAVGALLASPVGIGAAAVGAATVIAPAMNEKRK